jgi:hypothetical protein
VIAVELVCGVGALARGLDDRRSVSAPGEVP